MKKVLVFALSFVLMAIAVVSVNAIAVPAGTSITTVPELTNYTGTSIDMTKLLTKGLTASTELATAYNKDTSLSDTQLADVAKTTYGLSVIGIKCTERYIGALIDGYWTNGNTGSAIPGRTIKQYGAFAYQISGNYYNVKGEKATTENEGKNGYLYQMMLTFNFGKVKNIDMFGFSNSTASVNNFPQAADIYVSNDGVNWTLVGYYDRVAARMKGGDLTFINSSLLGKDALGSAGSTANGLIVFNMPAGTQAQYLRLAATAQGGKTTPADKTVYDNYVNLVGTPTAFREMFVWGSDVHVHVPVVDQGYAATCTTDGLTDGSHCSDCKEVIVKQEVIPAGHDVKIDAAVAPTCTETGLTEGSHCARCKAVLTEQVLVDATKHTWVKDEDVAVTCTTDGKIGATKCSTCQTVLEAEIVLPKLNHQVVVDAAIPATCTTKGKTEGSHCGICDFVLTPQTEVATLNHDYGETVYTVKSADANNEGVNLKVCKLCGDTQEVAVAKLEGGCASSVSIASAVVASLTALGTCLIRKKK